jgi:hypothetical protein
MKEFIKKRLRILLESSKLNRYKTVDRETFKDVLLNITTLDLEDSQVRYPNIDGKKQKFLFGGNKYYLSILDRGELPSVGPFELVIENDDDEIIGFIRGTKNANIISFNLIHIQEDYRGSGIGTDIYEKFLNKGFIIKSDSEITDATYSMYDRLVLYDYKPLIFDDGTVGLIKNI